MKGYILDRLSNSFDKLKSLEKKIVDPVKIQEMIKKGEDIYPGAITYIQGKLVYWDISSAGISNLSFGTVQEVVILPNNEADIILDTNEFFNQLDREKFYIFKRKDINGIYQDVHQPYKIVFFDSSQKRIRIIPVDLVSFEPTHEIKPDVKVGDKLYQAGAWKLLLNQDTDIHSIGKIVDKASLLSQIQILSNQESNLEAYLNALLNAGYSEDDPEYIKTQNQLTLIRAEKEFYQALYNCSSCDPTDESTWTDEVKEKYQALQHAKEAANVPPPSTKEIIIKTVEKIGLSILGSIDIYMTGYYVDAPNATQPGLPNYISNYSQTTTRTEHFRGKSPGPVGINENLGVNYLVIKGAYNKSVKGTGYVEFVLDAAKAAGVEAQRGNYKYSAMSALFKVKERNFWDYTGGNVTWQYFVNMIPLTDDPDSPDYGKFKIRTEISAYKDYHNAQLGARWFIVLNKFRGF